MIGLIMAIAFFVVAECIFGGIFMLLFKQNKWASLFAGFLCEILILLVCFDLQSGLGTQISHSVKLFKIAVLSFIGLDIFAIAFVLVKNKWEKKPVFKLQEITKTEVLMYAFFGICILLECGMYLVFMPENGFESMARVGVLLREDILCSNPLYNIMAAIKNNFHITIGRAVCLVLPVWFILNYNLLLLATANELLKERVWRGLFLAISSLIVLYGAYNDISPTSALLHGQCDLHGVYLMILAPIGILYFWMLWKKQNRVLWSVIAIFSLAIGLWIEKERGLLMPAFFVQEGIEKNGQLFGLLLVAIFVLLLMGSKAQRIIGIICAALIVCGELFWLIPTVILCALALCLVLSKVEEKNSRVVICIGTICIIVFCGRFCYSNSDYEKTPNYKSYVNAEMEEIFAAIDAYDDMAGVIAPEAVMLAAYANDEKYHFAYDIFKMREKKERDCFEKELQELYETTTQNELAIGRMTTIARQLCYSCLVIEKPVANEYEYWGGMGNYVFHEQWAMESGGYVPVVETNQYIVYMEQ